MTYGYFTADISTDAAYARPTDLRKSALRAFTGENFPSAPADAFPISAPPKITKGGSNRAGLYARIAEPLPIFCKDNVQRHLPTTPGAGFIEL